MCSENHGVADTPLVTVIIASYNHARYIEASINSVINQTYKNIELLVVDDGSKDESPAVLKRLQEQHGFDLRFQANQGLARTLNDAIARARGDLIVPFGSDDIMMPHRIATQVEYMNGKPEVGICSANIETIDQDGNVMGAREQRNRNLPFRRLDFDDLFLDRKPGPMAATLMLRREALEKVGGFNADIRLEDVYIELSIARAGYFIDVLGEVLAQYRDHPTNTFKNGRFMVDNVLRTFAVFSDHPQYEQVCMRFRNSMVLKYANRDKALSREILSQIPLKYWNRKTLRGIWRMVCS
ncbi:glycosyltransferase [Pseudomonas putida]|uniref:glycosyltransferase family 2 protein n=1 Tax=Pseudomonas TaxID=286 RepID=UPI000F7A4348|nr:MULTISPECIES: glycosyltransferase [Pseudomonas]MBM7399858.1 alpha-1,3-rhamnosyltransferase [Pseudomonas sp. M5]NSX22960.1 glycosyltransferase [Pseudomonas putida]RRV44856.1 glycosyltransferase [Pseudomonas sp. p106]UTL82473.1 glycosyltransferase [Pseudomonas putida]GLH30807.1 alpha-1,3-rhamnosyltransferase WapR [Pseudomonas sp. BR1R-5]